MATALMPKLSLCRNHIVALIQAFTLLRSYCCSVALIHRPSHSSIIVHTVLACAQARQGAPMCVRALMCVCALSCTYVQAHLSSAFSARARLSQAVRPYAWPCPAGGSRYCPESHCSRLCCLAQARHRQVGAAVSLQRRSRCGDGNSCLH